MFELPLWAKLSLHYKLFRRMSQKYYTHTEQRARACTLFTVIHARVEGMLAMISSSGRGEGFVPSPQSVSHQPSARKRTIHSLITCQSLHTKLALLYFFFFGTISGHRDKQPLRNDVTGGMGRKDNNGRNRTSTFKDEHGYQEVMLRSDLVLNTITACLAQVPALFWYLCEFHSSYFVTLFSSVQLLILAMSSSVFCLEI